MKTQEEIKNLLKEALKIVPKYPHSGFCGCGEGWQNECCTKMDELLGEDGNGQNYCIYNYIGVK